MACEVVPEIWNTREPRREVWVPEQKPMGSTTQRTFSRADAPQRVWTRFPLGETYYVEVLGPIMFDLTMPIDGFQPEINRSGEYMVLKCRPIP